MIPSSCDCKVVSLDGRRRDSDRLKAMESGRFVVVSRPPALKVRGLSSSCPWDWRQDSGLAMTFGACDSVRRDSRSGLPLLKGLMSGLVVPWTWLPYDGDFGGLPSRKSRLGQGETLERSGEFCEEFVLALLGFRISVSRDPSEELVEAFEACLSGLGVGVVCVLRGRSECVWGILSEEVAAALEIASVVESSFHVRPNHL